MFNALAVTSLFVLDQEEARDFYANKLGLEVSNDFEQGPTRWLTVKVPGQAGPDIYLQEPGSPAMDEATAAQVRDLISKGAIGWLALTTDDCRTTYETLVARGVEITQEPTEHFYGIDMGVRDPFGNQIRILQPAAMSQEASTPA
ncbi:MAG TPA: VOC family protein [Chloroflexota bacterium]|nr:VOC family protein [Chloroflexota bacterium]